MDGDNMYVFPCEDDACGWQQLRDERMAELNRKLEKYGDNIDDDMLNRLFNSTKISAVSLAYYMQKSTTNKKNL